MQHPSDASDKNDAEVRAVIEQYIDALNTGDLTRIGSLSTGLAEEELNPQARAGYVRKMAYQIEKHGPMHIHDFSILARGDIVYVAYVYTEYEDQKNPKPEDIYFSPGARVRYNMYRTGGKWKVMSVDRYIGDER
ncbi:nuclear transport factor 2 family protein [Mycobacteroides abscessus]|uniref:nuclear transport factor 2 family protein n=1 Tax=Mycobacteroides abscessus TaxID=36809 RepID=UPI001F1E6BCE|nr:nuclear transport factor 2 family protein [Mycobacteroides abscessus]